MINVAKAILYDDKEKTILILKRSKHLINEESPWEWDLPGGHAERDETNLRALVREVWEETALDMYRLNISRMHSSENTVFYFVDKWRGTINLSDEHDSYAWIDPGDIRKYDIGDNYASAVEKAMVDISYDEPE